MSKTLFMTMVGALALLASACNGGATNACNSQCEQGKTGGCIPSDTDCTSYCMGADAAAAALRAQADTAGCRSQFDAQYSCTSSGSACDTSTRCMAQIAAYGQCIGAFCIANPTSPVCAGP
ncbi:hypothetical protein ARNL5_02505 [Anaerolineae bacterium]|nr:hypothetical protein [Sandaracinaceae bacterium]CAG0981305.1 hypothetical protein ARNL5_02505 [Anaerolineae bacterium]